MADFYQIQQGVPPQGKPPVPPQHPYPQAGRQPPTQMGFQQRPVDPRLSHQMPQHQPLRSAPQPAARLPQQQCYTPDFASPQSQQRYPSMSNAAQLRHLQDNIIPDEFNSFIEVSDLTAANFTEDNYYQYLSTPIAIRFEKVEPRIKHDSAGEEIKATWLNCTRRLLPKFDSVQAEEEIQQLNRKDHKKGLTLPKKLQSLGPNAQYQIRRAEQDLEAGVKDRRFHIVLKQIDWTLEPIEKHRCKTANHRSSRKPQMERTSITAYFYRCPKPDETPSELYRKLETEKLQGQMRLDQQHRERDMRAQRERQELAREKREHEANMAAQQVRQEEARAMRIREERMRDQAGNGGQHQQPPQQGQHPNQMPQNQQRPPGQQMPPGQAMQHNQPFQNQQRAPGQQMHPNQAQYPNQMFQNQQRPPGQQMPPPIQQPQAQGRPPMNQQQGPMPQRHPHPQPNSGQHQQGVPQQFGGQMGAQQQQQGPPPNVRQMPPHPQQQAQFARGPNGPNRGHTPNGNRPIITVTRKHSKHSKRNRSRSRSRKSYSGSSSDSGSLTDSESEYSSASTKLSSISSGSPRMHGANGGHIKPKALYGGAATRRHVVDDFDSDSDDDHVHRIATTTIHRAPTPRRRHSVTRLRPDNTYIQTGSDRKLKLSLSPSPRKRPTTPVADPLTQVREAYLAGHADRGRLLSESQMDRGRLLSDGHADRDRLLSDCQADRDRLLLLSEADRLDAAAWKYRPTRRPWETRSESFSDVDADRLESLLPRKYQQQYQPQARRLSRSDIQQGLGVPRPTDYRRMTGSEVEYKLSRDRAARRDFEFEEDFAAPRGLRASGLDRHHHHQRYDDWDLEDVLPRSRHNDLGVEDYRERQRRRESKARDLQDDIMRGISDESNPFNPVPRRRNDGRY